MPRRPDQSAEHLHRALQRLQASQRLKNAPILHAWQIGKLDVEISFAVQNIADVWRRGAEQGTLTPGQMEYAARIQEFAENPKVTKYTPAWQQEDEAAMSVVRLRNDVTWEDDTLVFADPAAVTAQLSLHFHPILWPELMEASLWDLVLETVPPMQVARVHMGLKEEDRWLYDERSQRAAETLTWRLEQGSLVLPAKLNAGSRGRKIFEDYLARLARGTHPRRWLIEQLRPRKLALDFEQA